MDLFFGFCTISSFFPFSSGRKKRIKNELEKFSQKEQTYQGYWGRRSPNLDYPKQWQCILWLNNFSMITMYL